MWTKMENKSSATVRQTFISKFKALIETAGAVEQSIDTSGCLCPAWNLCPTVLFTQSNNMFAAFQMVDPNLREELLDANVSRAAATHPSNTEDSLTRTNGIIPGAIAASVFIAFLLALYAVLWKCMTSPPQRKKSKRRVRAQQKMPV